MPAIRESYGAGAQQVQWVVNAYLLPLSALLLLGGALGDHFGRRRLLVIGTAIFAVTSLVCALAPSLPILLAARAAQGIGAALLLPNSLALLNAAFSGEKRGRAVGIWAAAGAAMAAVAPLIGGWLVGTVGWPAIFYINLPLALGAILLALRFVEREPRGRRGAHRLCRSAAGDRRARRPDLCADFVVGDAALHQRGVDCAGRRHAMLVAASCAVEYRRGSRAMMPLDLFKGRCFSGLNLLTFLLYGAFAAAMLLIPYVLITSGGYSPVAGRPRDAAAAGPDDVGLAQRWARSPRGSARACR